MLRSALKIGLAVLLTCTALPDIAAADDIQISGIVAFSALDGAPDDHDGAANGVFTVDDGNLVIEGTIQCNDGPPLPGNAGACPIRISVSGNLVVEAGGAIVAENRIGGGSGANITLEVGGNLSLYGPSGNLPGAVVSSGTTTGSGAAGSISVSVDGAIELEAGSILSASAAGGSAGAVGIEAGGGIRIAGLVASGPGTSLLASRWSGAVLAGGSTGQSGGTILLRSTSADEPGILIETTGSVVSQGQSSGPQLILLEACGIEAHGLVAAVSKTDSPARVALRSGKGILVDGRDLAAGSGSHLGRVRADSIEGGAATHLVDLFAGADIQISGPTSGTTDLFVASANPGTQGQRTGGSVSAVSLSGALAASGNAFEAGRALSGNKGGKIDLRSAGDADLADAHLRAVGGYLAASGSRRGGQISVRSYSGEIRWTFGTGDVRPTGSGATPASRGTITLTACTGIDTTGTTFPVLGSSVAPFPVEADSVCSPTAPSLPLGEPSLPVCNEPPVADGQVVITDEDTAVTITLTGSDPNGDSLTFSIVTPPDHGTLGPLTSPTATSVQVVYTPDTDYNGSDSFVFQVEDGNGGTDTATVEISINAVADPPVADDDSYEVDEGGILNQAAPGVLDGDQDPDGDSLTAMLVAGPAHATSFTLNPDGSFSYTHDGSDTTSDSFTYKANDGSLDSNVATVTITVNAVNDPPTADDDSYNVNEGGTLNVLAPGVLDGDQDPEGDSLTAVLVTSPEHDTSFTLNSDGSFSYTHDGSETTSDSFTYRAFDGALESNTATVTIIINSVNDPPVANPDTAAITEEAPNVAAANTVSGNVLSNDTDPDSSLTVSAVAGGTVGSPRAGSYGSVTINSDGSYTYTLDDTNPAVNALAPGGMLNDAFGYTASDGSLPSSSTLTVTIHGADDPATPDEDAFDFIGNTQLEVDRDTADTPEVLATTPPIPAALGVLDGDDDPDGGPAITISGIVDCDDLTAPFDCVLAGQGEVSLQADGSFSFVPEAGDTDPTASFQYTLTGNPTPATVTLTRFERVWYVDPNADDGGNGTSALPFNSLDPLDGVSGEGDSDSPVDYVFIHDGTLALSVPMPMEDNQHLIGEGAGLSIPVNLNGNVSSAVLVPAGIRPQLTHDSGDVIVVTTAVPVEVVGLSLASLTGNAIDLTSTAALTGSGTLTLGNNEIRGAGAEGIDVNLNVGTTGTLTLNITGNTWDLTGTHTGNAVDINRAAGTLNLDFSNNANIFSNASGVVIDGTGGGTTTITGFANNSVHPNTGGTGISVNSVMFDGTPGGPFQTVSGGTTVVGAPGVGNGVGAQGVVLTNVAGDLSFTDLDVFADGGAGLRVTGTGAVNVGAGTGTRMTVGAGVGIVEAAGGPAVDVNNATIDLQLSSLKSTTPSTGVSLVNVSDGTTAAVFSVGSGSSIIASSGAGPAFNVSGGNAAIAYGGTIINNGTGRAVSITTWSGDDAGDDLLLSGAIDENGAGILLNGNGGSRAITFSGGMDIDTTSGEGLAATSNSNALGLHITGTNTIDSISATALRVTSTTIGSSNLNFRSISSGNDTAAADPANGIVLSNTGSSGGLIVTGNGGACTEGSSTCTGGWIRNMTGGDDSGATPGGAGIVLNNTANVSLTRMRINDTSNYGIRGTSVSGFTFANGVVDGANGTNVNTPFNEGSLVFFGVTGTSSGITGASAITNSTIMGGRQRNIAIDNSVGTLNLTVSGNTIKRTSDAAGDDGFFLEADTTANVKLAVTNNTFARHGGDHINVTMLNNAVVDVTITGNTLHGNYPGTPEGNHPIGLTQGIFLFGATFNGTCSYEISNNGTVAVPFRGSRQGGAIHVNKGSGTGTFSGSIENNVIGDPAVTGSGSSEAFGIIIGARGTGAHTTLINNNLVRQYFDRGIVLEAGEGSAALNAAVTNNAVSNFADATNSLHGIHSDNGILAGDTNPVCLQISGNSVATAGNEPAGGADIRLRRGSSTTVRLPGVAGATNADATNLLQANNPTATTITVTGNGFSNGAACPLP